MTFTTQAPDEIEQDALAYIFQKLMEFKGDLENEN